jgi:hypothetical protein
MNWSSGKNNGNSGTSWSWGTPGGSSWSWRGPQADLENDKVPPSKNNKHHPQQIRIVINAKRTKDDPEHKKKGKLKMRRKKGPRING